MLIEELIEELKKLDPKAKVVAFDGCDEHGDMGAVTIETGYVSKDNKYNLLFQKEPGPYVTIYNEKIELVPGVLLRG